MTLRVGVREPVPPRRARRRVAPPLLLILAAVSLTGCGDVHARRARGRLFLTDGTERVTARWSWYEGSAAVLERHGLTESAALHPAKAASVLEARLTSRPEPGGALALGGLYYRAGLAHETTQPVEALANYRDAAVLASLALSDPGPPGDLADAVDVHNRAVTRLVRLAGTRRVAQGRTWRQSLVDQGLIPAATDPRLHPERISVLAPTGDLRVIGMQNMYCGDGLGVPVVGDRYTDAKSPDPQERYFPQRLKVGFTAVVDPGGGLAGGDWRAHPATLVLHEAHEPGPTIAGGRSFPLAYDRTTPVAAQVDARLISALEMTGLFRSEFERGDLDQAAGLYMFRPYQPGKIPVVLVHGLYSSPRAWVQTLNELGNDPELERRYQFWVFMYPTGLPIPGSAGRLRKAIAQTRETFDPSHADPTFDKMVVVGHSMGGIIARSLTKDVGMRLWDAAIHRRPEELKASPELRTGLQEMLIFRPVPNVRRVVCIAAPHRGSPIANDLFGRTVSAFIRPNTQQQQAIDQLEELNGPDVIDKQLRSRYSINSVNNLRLRNPVLEALDQAPADPSVPLHSISFFMGNQLPYDGVVPYTSSYVEDAASDLVLPGIHTSQQKPEVSLELKRILREHLAANGG